MDEKTETPQATLPDITPAPLQIIEGYLKQAEEALTRINDHRQQLAQMQAQRDKELLVVTGQKDLLLALQKQLANVTKLEVKS